MSIQKFNVRVYGILINSNNQVLVTDELIKGHEITKFPGGGLEFGEGLIDALKREFMEETNNEVKVMGHFYTTDYFQISAYDPTHQIISIYYLVAPTSEFKINAKQKPYDFDTRDKGHAQSFRWIDLKTISENDFTLPIDKIVGRMLREQFNK
jgi:8-oxo-dGTP diphosphatase